MTTRNRYACEKNGRFIGYVWATSAKEASDLIDKEFCCGPCSCCYISNPEQCAYDMPYGA